jgi:Cd2+/Zn2+-exporting ATPase
VTNFTAVEGIGVMGIVTAYGEKIEVEVEGYGGAPVPDADEAWSTAFRSAHEGSTMLYVWLDGEFQLCLALTDKVRDGAVHAVAALHAVGVSTTVLTGDADLPMRGVLQATGVKEGIARCKPQDKLSWIRTQQAAGLCTALVGDGVNDSPALKAADVGVAMGVGSSAMAVAAADVVILNNELRRLPTLMRLSRFVRQVVWQNIALAIGIKVITL